MKRRLYHTKNHRGTTTNYAVVVPCGQIIPYQEPPGNYNPFGFVGQWLPIIPYQEPPGNYNYVQQGFFFVSNYTIPRTTGELQQKLLCLFQKKHYTIPRTTGELQLQISHTDLQSNYTIPRTTGELQQPS